MHDAICIQPSRSHVDLYFLKPFTSRLELQERHDEADEEKIPSGATHEIANIIISTYINLWRQRTCVPQIRCLYRKNDICLLKVCCTLRRLHIAH